MSNTTLEKWEEKTLGEICKKISAGGDKPDVFSKESTDICKVPIYSNGIENNGLYGYTDVPAIMDEAITISARGTIGFVCKRCEPYYPIVRLISVIPNNYINVDFMAYALKFMVPTGNGSSIPQLTVPMLKNKKIKYPPLLEQERIVAKLDKSFEAIDKVKANAEQNLTNAKELFESELNKVFTENTEGWEEKTLKEVCKKISAGGDKPENFSKVITENCEVPIYSNGIENDGLYGYTDVPAITEEAITISARGTIGFICKRVKPYYPIVRLISAIPNDHINIDFMEYALKFMVPTGNGSSIPQLTVPMLKDKKIKYPSLLEQRKIVEKLDALQEQTKKLEAIYTKKIKDLDELKQSILQKAFRGEL